MNKIRITALISASALAAGIAVTLPAVTSASVGSPPPAGVRLTGSMRPDPAIHYHTRLASPRALKAGTAKSTNWSGYAITATSGHTIRRIQGLFTVPDVNCANSTLGTNGTFFSAWAGLDGFTDNTVEQAGIGAQCTSTTGPATYFSFYEMFPKPGVVMSGISPGDAIFVIIQHVSAGWQLDLKDITNGGGFFVTLPCPSGSTCRDANGEVITEDPNGAVAQGVNLADFGDDNQTALLATTPSGASGGLGSTALWTSTEVFMVDPAGHFMAEPGPLYGGQAFYVGWISSS
jgi:hypothetical protein